MAGHPPHPGSGPHTHGTPGKSPTAKFPNSVWDGTTPNRPVAQQQQDPNADDFNQLVTEMQAVQTEILPTAWVGLTPSGGWVQKAGSSVLGYKLSGNRVRLRGAATPGTKTDGTAVFTLPAAARPALPATFPICAFGPDTNDAGARLLIGTDGTCKIYGVSTATSLDFNSVNFALDQ